MDCVPTSHLTGGHQSSAAVENVRIENVPHHQLVDEVEQSQGIVEPTATHAVEQEFLPALNAQV